MARRAVKFLVFTLVLAAVVLVVSLTALRPVFNNTVLSWAAENPAALQLPFVKDLVREDLGAALTDAGLEGRDPGGIRRRVGRYGVHHRRPARQRGSHHGSARVRVHRHRQKLTGELQQGNFVLRRNMTPDELVHALLAAPEIKYIDIGLRTGLRLEQITAKLQTLEGLEMDPQEFYDLAKSPPADARRGLPVAQEDPRDGAEGRVARGLPLAGDLPRPARHDRRGARPADARRVRRERR